ncbi:ABC transporter substrate-binding protein [Bacillus sp. OK048]|uniref:ABC transporter substrate-binding protein n=1 Tax=Bacillus sp. OK048 TaxID=1882761 RepID=UPI000883CBF8|nr:ABC transporter substrate-binding protein [Bacillus sp. OK048]SDN38650.1 NitT/TauT family transport system substrate-binding protein [Bacillus sp. OK048]
MKMKAIITAATIILLLLLSGCGSKNKEQPATAEKELDRVTVANWSQPLSEQTNLLVSEEKDFFRNQGLSVELIPGAGGGDAIKNIISGKADIAFTDPGSLYFALNQGGKLKVIYNIYPQNVFNVVSLKERNILKPEDLKGKKIGVYSFSSGTRQNLLVLLNQAGLTEKDVTIVETGLLNFAPLMQGQVDATAATDTGLVTAMEKGLVDVNVLKVKDYLNVPSDVFVVTEKTYNEKKDMLKKFIEGYQNSAEWMINHPEEAADLAVKYAIDGKDQKHNLEIIKLRNESSISNATYERGLGALEADVLQQGADTYKKLGLIGKDLNMEDVIAEDLLPKMK